MIRCYQSVGRPDPNCASNVANAHAAGMQVREFNEVSKGFYDFSCVLGVLVIFGYIFRLIFLYSIEFVQKRPKNVKKNEIQNPS